MTGSKLHDMDQVKSDPNRELGKNIFHEGKKNGNTICNYNDSIKQDWNKYEDLCYYFLRVNKLTL
jgi:hypothetical protein